MNRQYYSPIFVTGACLLLSLLYCPPYSALSNDVEVFRYMGLAISKGLIPYRDIFDHKPPLIYFFNYIGLLSGGAWGFWAINTGLALLVTWRFLLLCRMYRLPYPWILPILFNLMLRDNLIDIGNNGTRQFTSLFFMLFFCILIGKGRYRDYWLGLLSGLVFFTQQEQILPLIPFLIYNLLNREAVSPGLKMVRMAAGFLTVLLPILLYFAWFHSLTWFWQEAFVFNFSWYITEKKTFINHFSTVKRVLDSGNYEMPFMIAVTLGILSLFFRHKKKGLIIAALAAVALTSAPEFMGGRYNGSTVPLDFFYYFLPMSAAVCILLFVIWAFTENDLLNSKERRLAFTILLCTSLVFTMLQHATHLTRRNNDRVIASPESNYLRQHRPGDYQLYALIEGDYAYLYNELGILAPSRWIYQHFWCWYDRWDPDQAVLHSIGADLLRHHTTYILFNVQSLSSFRNPASAAWLLSFLNTYYERVALPGKPDSILWKLKGTPD
jgi:hypothetical protein